MSDIAYDPYEGLETDEERQAVYRKLLEEYNKENAADNWELYKANERYTDKLIETQRKTDEFFDKWMMSLAAGSFGLSFTFISSLVPLENAVCKPLLIAAWACFALVLAIQLAGLVISSIRYILIVAEADKNLSLKYEGKEPENKRGSIYFDPNRVIMYAVLFIFLGGLLCLLAFVAKNL
ncbi:MAG: hypothetical protein LBK66_02920 [Spirochaetaceae bacterium]|jgi:hypothetical protein|nr:hypothetical protein [Spirochaetaceae bacterium]